MTLVVTSFDCHKSSAAVKAEQCKNICHTPISGFPHSHGREYTHCCCCFIRATETEAFRVPEIFCGLIGPACCAASTGNAMFSEASLLAELHTCLHCNSSSEWMFQMWLHLLGISKVNEIIPKTNLPV